MFGMRWRLFRLVGIPISVDASWLVVLALLTLSLGSAFPILLRQYFPGITPDLAPYDYWIMGLVAALAFFVCILLHELRHAVVARSQGMPIRGITLFLFGGIAEMEDEPDSAGGEFLMAIAGPIVSVILAVALGFLAWLGYNGGWPHPVVLVLGNLAIELRPAMLDTLGLEATLRWLAEQHQQRTSSEVQVVGHLSGAPLPPDMAIACFRVVQEALTNVARHASAWHVWIELRQSDKVVEVAVRDDGTGFDVAPTQEQAATRGSLGLVGMRERIQILGGSLSVESEPGRGTRIRATFPVSEDSEQPAEMGE